MHFNPLFSTALATTLAVTAPTLLPTQTLAHDGHGHEFNATGAVLPVHVNEELDGQLGVEVTAIAESGPGDSVLIPSSAIVTSQDNEGVEVLLVFIKTEDTYNPVEVALGDSLNADDSVNGAIAITEGLSVGDEIVTAGTLVLYAESRKAYDAHELEHAAAGGASNKIKRIAKGLIVFTFGVLVGGGAVIVATRNSENDDDTVDGALQDETPQNA